MAIAWDGIVITEEDYRLAAENGISRKILGQRIHEYGWDKERAINTRLRVQTDHGDWPKIAEQNGITKKSYYKRVLKHNIPPGQAATLPRYSRLRERKGVGMEIESNG
ncbi:hypothetical protein D3C73_308960 [compost metagenome]